MLNELLEDYQEFNEDEALDEFIRLLWSSDYGCRTYRKTYAFKLQPELLNNNDELIKIFEPYQKIKIRHVISYYNDKPNSIDMIRIHINNMYMYLTNSEVYMSKEYFNFKIQPKKLYFKTIERIKNGEVVNIDEIRNQLLDFEKKTEELRLRDVGKKIELPFNEYKKIINGYIFRIFNNYKSPFEYEQENGWELNVIHDAWHEDNYIVKYFCKSLTGYMKNYIRNNKEKEIRKKKCNHCNEEFIIANNNQKYCTICSPVVRREKVRKNMKKMRSKKLSF
ncbi:hypothetical protein [Lysinibacillus sp. BPa_S21]|uniref:hypothetical protein n=1 Tax=Lysinibacillus sp. BPa_S21 TaxID=2932478 RepID=UPI0020131867|nr:hypothetical protein [Lysinibacillus sp. BPa_S21]MCL1696277.1 hypothetical protein [Lysinibacillus sp. BPa_S21]